MAPALLLEAPMRRVALVACLVGCTTASREPVPDSDPESEPGGGLPTPRCGEGACSECVGCGVSRFGCFGWAGTANLNSPGRCLAESTSGTLEATIGGVAFASREAVAIVDHGRIAVSAQAGDPLVVLFAPAQIGNHDCASSSAAIAYFAQREIQPAVDFRSVVPGAPPVACTLTVTRIGDVGQRIEGAFTATLLDWRATTLPRPTLSIEGTFQIERGPFAL
jgi:hypothetical protein